MNQPHPASPATPTKPVSGAVKIVMPGTRTAPQTEKAEMSQALASLPHPREFGRDLPWARRDS